MKQAFATILLSVFAASAFAGVDATDITAQLRAEYNGQFITDSHGVARAAVLADGRVLIETEGELAKYLLYNLPKAPDLVEYQPRQGPASWMNYFIRQGDNVLCGLTSYDLQMDPLPSFKCRFVVDSSGVVSSYTDRPNIPYRDEQFQDFFYEQISKTSSPANAYNFIRTNMPGVSFQFQFFGEAAATLYNSLTKAKMFKDHMGPYIETDVRLGQSIWCLHMSTPDDFSNDPERTMKCRVQFGFDGKASQDYGK